MSLQAIYLEDEFADIVSKVSAKLTAQLKIKDPNITGVHYEFGHPLEIIETLTQKSETDWRYTKYPVVCLFLDIKERRGVEVGMYGEARLNLAIITGTDKTFKAAKRLTETMKPILMPIYMELMNEIALRGDLFRIQSVESIPHEMTKRYYWGRDGLFGKEGNIFGDYVDAIEINNLELNYNLNYCPKPAV